MNPPALAIQGLTIRDGAGATLVHDVHLALPPAGALTVIGETGSGKSLLAQAIFGLLPMSFTVGGRLLARGHEEVAFADRGGLQALWRRWSMLLPQEPSAALDPTMRFGRQLGEIVGGNQAVVSRALTEVDLARQTGRLYPFEASGGMAQRSLVAAAMLTDAPVLVADEPTKGLDSARVGHALGLLHGMLDRGRGLMVITHDYAVAQGLPGTLAVMKDGRIVEQGDRAVILMAPSDPYTRAWLDADPDRWPKGAKPSAGSTPILTGRNLAFAWPKHPALFTDLDIDLRPGQMVAVTGASGCGKTTLGDVLLGLRAPLRGRVSWAGDDPYLNRSATRRLRRRYQKLHQNPASAFMPGEMIGRQIGFLAEIVPGLDLTERLPALLERLRLRTALLARLPSEVSGGEAQRLALLRLLLLEPLVIVADEPTSHLDPIVQREVIGLLRECVDRDGLAVMLISHDQALVGAVADDEIRIV